MKTRLLTTDTVKEIKQLFMQGHHTAKQLADRFSVKKPLIYAILRERLYKDVQVSGYEYSTKVITCRRLSEEDRHQIQIMTTQEGKSPYYIAKVLRVTPPTIYRYLKSMGA